MRHIMYTSVLVIFFMVTTNITFAAENDLTIVCDEWPPYQTVEQDGTVSGFSTKVIKEVFKRMGVNIKSLKAYPWKRAILMMENGAADALFSANYSKDRTAFAHYPEEQIVVSPWVVWTRVEDKLQYNDFSDLKGKKVGVVRGYSYTPEFWEALKSNGSYDEAPDDATNFRKLNIGRIDMLVAELGNGFAIMKQSGLTQIVPHKGNPIKSDGLYIMFNKTRVSEAFVKRFSDTLKQLKEESLYQFLQDEYFKQ